MVRRERAQNADARIFKETWKFKENAEKDNMEHRVQTNSTTFPDGACPELKKLDLDTFKCPFCHRTGSYPGLVAHLQSHQRSLVKYGGYNVYKCHLDCVASSHYHCGLCPRIIGRKEMFFNHFKNCCTQLPTTLASMATAPNKTVTPATAPMTATTRSLMIPATTSTAPVMAPATTSTAQVMAPATTSTAPVMAPATTSTTSTAPVMAPATTSTAPVMAPATTSTAPVMAPATTSTAPVMAPATTTTAPMEGVNTKLWNKLPSLRQKQEML
ncbi:integumentary mucin C.1-like [Trematomus bernacchii]|uniref:integumentary mucin C.1-like n=1 Tax=Trematomus bernacchii TaxID=40690 RepID=UPI00146C9C07|nr:integumentary mucin C.1-like [Trematomus bernacchii]